MTTLRFPRGVYGITPEWEDTARLLSAVADAAAGGMTALQFRRKTGEAEARRDQAAALRALCHDLGVAFLVNDDWRLAREIGADGVHLGRDDGSPAEARQALGANALIGCSCYDDLSRAARALAAGADYIAFGAVYPSRIKPDAVRASLDLLRQGRALVERSARPGEERSAVVAIGGITAGNAPALIEAGTDSIALISGLFGEDDIRAAAARCARLFEAGAWSPPAPGS